MAVNRNIASAVEKILTPVIEGLGYGIWDVEYVKEGAEWYLRVTIDSEKGISIDDCEKVHRAIDPVLDSVDPIEGSYILEVSSPGIERILKRPVHFASVVGQKVSIRLFAPDENGKKTYEGILAGSDDKAITVKTEKGDMRFEISRIAKAMTVYDFDN